jgi:hypothetical protein
VVGSGRAVLTDPVVDRVKVAGRRPCLFIQPLGLMFTTKQDVPVR